MTRQYRWILETWLRVVVVVLVGAALSAPTASHAEERYNTDPYRTVGPRACGDCHENAYLAWLESNHHKLPKFHNKAKVETIVKNLGDDALRIDNYDRVGRCIRCHRTVREQRSRFTPISGVSCESCHGAALEWIGVHADRRRPNRMKTSRKAGMVTPSMTYEIAARCYGCHIVTDEALVAAKHPAGSESFDFLRWSLGQVRHNFQNLDAGCCQGREGRLNRDPDKARKRILYLVGSLVDLEYSLRARAGASEAAYSERMQRRVNRALRRLSDPDDPDHALREELKPVIERVKTLMNPQTPPDPKSLLEEAERVQQLAKEIPASLQSGDNEALDLVIEDIVDLDGYYGTPWKPKPKPANPE